MPRHDELHEAARESWSVLIHGPDHHLDASDKLRPARVTGRRIRRPA